MILSLILSYSRFLLTEIINNYRNEGTKRLLEFLTRLLNRKICRVMMKQWLKKKRKKKFSKILIYRLIGRKDWCANKIVKRVNYHAVNFLARYSIWRKLNAIRFNGRRNRVNLPDFIFISIRYSISVTRASIELANYSRF